MPFSAITVWVGIILPKNIFCMCDIHPTCEFGDIPHKGERRWMVSFSFFVKHAEWNKPHVWCARSLPSCSWERSVNRIPFSEQAPLGCPRIAYMVITSLSVLWELVLKCNKCCVCGWYPWHIYGMFLEKCHLHCQKCWRGVCCVATYMLPNGPRLPINLAYNSWQSPTSDCVTNVNCGTYYTRKCGMHFAFNSKNFWNHYWDSGTRLVGMHATEWSTMPHTQSFLPIQPLKVVVQCWRNAPTINESLWIPPCSFGIMGNRM